MQKHVERVDALLEAARHFFPFGGGNDARDDVKGNQAFRPLRVGSSVAIDRKGDAVAVKRGICLSALLCNAGHRHVRQPILVRRVMGAHGSRSPHRSAQLWGMHFVKDIVHAGDGGVNRV